MNIPDRWLFLALHLQQIDVCSDVLNQKSIYSPTKIFFKYILQPSQLLNVALYSNIFSRFKQFIINKSIWIPNTENKFYLQLILFESRHYRLFWSLYSFRIVLINSFLLAASTMIKLEISKNLLKIILSSNLVETNY